MDSNITALINECIELDTCYKIYVQLHIIYDYLKKYHINDARTYFTDRNLNNYKICEIIQIVNNEINNKLNIKLMSSFGANMHLTDYSDIDFGVFIDTSNNDEYMCCASILEKLNYKFVKQNCSDYISYAKDINNINVEMKIRDYNASQIVLKLHNILDNLTNEEQMLLTYLHP